MNVSIGDRWEDFVEKLVKSGRYGAASELVREGRRLVEDVKTASKALHTTLDAIPSEEGFTPEEVTAALEPASSADMSIHFRPRKVE